MYHYAKQILSKKAFGHISCRYIKGTIWYTRTENFTFDLKSLSQKMHSSMRRHKPLLPLAGNVLQETWTLRFHHCQCKSFHGAYGRLKFPLIVFSLASLSRWKWRKCEICTGQFLLYETGQTEPKSWVLRHATSLQRFIKNLPFSRGIKPCSTIWSRWWLGHNWLLYRQTSEKGLTNLWEP